MYVVGSHIECLEMPLSDCTRLANRLFHRLSLGDSKDEWIALSLFAVVTFPRFALRQIRITVTVVKAIDGTAVVAV